MVKINTKILEDFQCSKKIIWDALVKISNSSLEKRNIEENNIDVSNTLKRAQYFVATRSFFLQD
jgi:hypothetical protein